MGSGGNKILIKLISLVVALCVLAPLTLPMSSASYAPPFSVMRIGMFFDSSELPSANLQNVGGAGSGYDFGYFESDRNFVSIGAWTDVSNISMMMDRNMAWDPGGANSGEYREGSAGQVVVGCFHVQLNEGYGSYAEARSEADRYQGAFVRYQSSSPNPFLVLIGQYISRTGAEEAIKSLGLGSATVNAGTSNTITIVRTGSNTILFEFDRGTTPLGVMPRSVNGEKTETWFRRYRYNGGFQYSRRDGALLTVVNMVNIEDYVKGILPYEMNNAWPIEALKAQALCARSYALRSLYRHSAHGFDLCVEEHCQVYRGRGAANERSDQAVNDTAGMYVTYNGQLAETFYASTNGGASENVENVWPEARPYLRGVVDPYEADIASRAPNYHWSLTYTPAQLTERLRSRITGFNLSTIATMRVSQHSPTGNSIAVTVTDVNGRSWTLSRRAQILAGLGAPTMRFNIGGERWEPGSIFANDPAQPVPSGAQMYTIDGKGTLVTVPGSLMYSITGSGNITTVDGETKGGGGGGDGPVGGVFTIWGSGNGHQVGMSQWGAFSMAQFHDKTYEDIIYFYYTGVDITKTS